MLAIDNDKLSSQSELLVENLKYYELLGKPLVDEYSKELDDKVLAIRNYLNKVREYNVEFDIQSLQRALVDLSTTIYFVNDKYEQMGLLEDMSKLRYKDKYNESYLTKQGNAKVSDKKYTVEQLRAFADKEALEENVINFIYSHAASAIKSKIDSANEVLKAVSKILSSKITEMSTFGVSNKYQG